MAHILDVILEKNHMSEKSFLDSVPNRKKTHIRMIFCYISHNRNNTKDISQRININHSIVLSYIRKIKFQVKYYSNLRKEIEQIENLIEEKIIKNIIHDFNINFDFQCGELPFSYRVKIMKIIVNMLLNLYPEDT